jgi:3-oxoadipate enol-lactonase
MPVGTAGYGSSEDPAWRRIDWSSYEHTEEVAGRRLHYVDMGEGGTPCLLLHGIGNSWRFWLETLPQLAERRRVLALDLPGFGESDLPDGPLSASSVGSIIDRFCGQLGIARVAVCGHSMGGMGAIQMAAAHPERVERLVLVGAALLSVMDLYSPAEVLRNPRLAATYSLAVLTAALPTPSWVQNGIAVSKLARNVFLRPYVNHPAAISGEVLRQALLGLGRRGALAAALNRDRFDLRRVARRCTAPVLFVNGAEDRFSPVPDVEALAAEMDEVQVVIMGDTGHWPMLERPHEFHQVLEDFLLLPSS